MWAWSNSLKGTTGVVEEWEEGRKKWLTFWKLSQLILVRLTGIGPEEMPAE
jgi:hypothetical protein